MTIHAIDKNMALSNVIVDYRDRPEGSESKLNTYSDGFKVLKMIVKLFRTYKPFAFFGFIALILALITIALFIPVFVNFIRTGLVPNFPTLIVSGFIGMAAVLSFFSGLILQTMIQKNKQDFEGRLHQVWNHKKELLKN